MKNIRLKKGREKSVLHYHPWLFESAIESVIGSPEPGETVAIYSYKKEKLAVGAYSPLSKIRIRIWSFNPDQNIDEHFFYDRIKESQNIRVNLSSLKNTNACRLVYAEADGLPGLIVDRYADILVFQCLSAGPEKWRDCIGDSLFEITGIDYIYERSDTDTRILEGLPMRSGFFRGMIRSTNVLIYENQINYLIDYLMGQKTGFYLDQRESRIKVKEHVRSSYEVLDCFCYTGSFTLSALEGGAATVTAIDSSESALKLAQENLAINNKNVSQVEFIQADVFQILRKYRDLGKKFDLIILDPPKFAPTVAQVANATRGYKDINLLALKLLRPEGKLITFSCSGGISHTLFQQIVTGAAWDAKVQAHIQEQLSQSSDHPISLNFPESNYLKGLVIYINKTIP